MALAGTYRAHLRGNTVEWLDEQPRDLPEGQPVEVVVTIPASHTGADKAEQGRRMAEALAAVSRAAGRGLPDGLAWEREVREERALPGRSSDVD
jgi:hypothetical protein